ncbi:MASE4 domain-containing protein [Paenibacillus sp. 481]|uniref:MASE4 domain-containing protein n=1 Tax=Paenibacillus sp. 481 TaxID=2835869 RepID=UPI001E2EA4BE|nr:MASE4 domain-containing protein [Paenibacillus sp. 481]
MTNLVALPSVRKQKRAAWTLGLIVLLASLFVLPIASDRIVEIRPFFPMLIAWIMFGNFMTAYLIYSQFRATGSKPMLLLSATYLFTGIITIPNLVTYPGIFSDVGLLHANSQTSIWFWVCWHAGFPIGILLYIYSIKRNTSSVLHTKSRLYTAITYGAVALFVLLLAFLLPRMQVFFPTVIVHDDYRLLISSGIGPVLWLLNGAAMIYLFVTTRMKSLLHLWLMLSVFTFFLDVTLTLFGGARYSIGWYVGRLNSLISATTVLFVFFNELNVLYVRLTRSKHELRQSKELVKSVLDSITDAFLSVDREWRYIYLNKAAEKYMRVSFSQVKGEVIWDINPGLLKSERYQQCRKVMEDKVPTEIVEFDEFRKRWLEVRIYPSSQGISVYFCDVTERMEAEKQMKEANEKLRIANRLLTDFSYTDGLTGVYNRRYFDMLLEQEWQGCAHEGMMLSLIMLDIDYFKRYNDTYGHQAGDECLRQVAQAIRETGEWPSGVVARYGGEEFAVILPRASAEEAAAVAEAVRHAVEALKLPHSASSVSTVVTCSLGIATELPQLSTHEADESGTGLLVQRADRALYAAKQAGRNRLVIIE